MSFAHNFNNRYSSTRNTAPQTPSTSTSALTHQAPSRPISPPPKSPFPSIYTTPFSRHTKTIFVSRVFFSSVHQQPVSILLLSLLHLIDSNVVRRRRSEKKKKPKSLSLLLSENIRRVAKRIKFIRCSKIDKNFVSLAKSAIETEDWVSGVVFYVVMGWWAHRHHFCSHTMCVLCCCTYHSAEHGWKKHFTAVTLFIGTWIIHRYTCTHTRPILIHTHTHTVKETEEGDWYFEFNARIVIRIFSFALAHPLMCELDSSMKQKGK